MANQPVPSTPPAPQEPISSRIINIVKGLFQPGSVKSLRIGPEVNTMTAQGMVTSITATIQSASFDIEADPSAAVTMAQNQAQAQIEAAKIQAQQAIAAARATQPQVPPAIPARRP